MPSIFFRAENSDTLDRSSRPNYPILSQRLVFEMCHPPSYSRHGSRQWHWTRNSLQPCLMEHVGIQTSGTQSRALHPPLSIKAGNTSSAQLRAATSTATATATQRQTTRREFNVAPWFQHAVRSRRRPFVQRDRCWICSVTNQNTSSTTAGDIG